jgi:hypothetical protein
MPLLKHGSPNCFLLLDWDRESPPLISMSARGGR